MEKSSNTKVKLSEKIAEYCLKFGENRDLKKFMRTHSSSSSSEFELCFHRLFSMEKQMTWQDESVAPKELPDNAECSISTNAKKLEWDSLADVGYKKCSSMSNISSLERSVLNDFRGDSCSKNGNVTGDLSKNQLSSAVLTPSELVHSHTEKWRETLENIKRKYATQPLASSTLVNPQSDLKKLQTSTSCNTSIRLDEGNESQSLQSERPKTNLIDSSIAECKQTKTAQANVTNNFHELERNLKTPSLSTDSYCKNMQSAATSLSNFRKRVESQETEGNKCKMISQEVQVNLSSKSSSILGSSTAPSSFEYRHPSRNYESIPKETKRCSPSSENSKNQVLQSLNSNCSSARSSRSRSTVNDNCAIEQLSLSSSIDNDKENANSTSQLSQGIKLICSLIDAQNLNRKEKKKLVRDIVAKMCKISSSSSNASQLSALSMQSLIESLPLSEISSLKANGKNSIEKEAKTINSRLSASGFPRQKQKQSMPTKISSTGSSFSSNHSINQEFNRKKSNEEINLMQHKWLSPMTQSEFDYEEEQSRKSRQASSSGQSVNSCVMENLKSQIEKCIKLNWVETQIQCLESMKNALLVQKTSMSSGRKSQNSSIISQKKIDKSAESANSHNIYDTVNTEKSSSSAKSQNNAELIVEHSSEDVENSVDKYKRYVQRTKETNTVYDRPSRDENEQRRRIFSKQTVNIEIREEQKIPKDNAENFLDSEESNQQVKSNRSRMKTPSQSLESEVSIESFADQNKKYSDTFPMKQRKQSNNQQQRHTYSEPRSVDELNRPSYQSKHPPSLRSSSTPAAVTTNSHSSSSMFCISSEMSIPQQTTSRPSIMTTTTTTTTSTTSTTTTRRDHFDDDGKNFGVSVQTGNSLLRTCPIFGPSKQSKSKHTQRTRAYPGKNQVVQAQPESVAYTITFHSNKMITMPREIESDDEEIEQSENNEQEMPTLQEQLYQSRPEFFVQARKRQETLNKLHTLRQQRDKKIREIIENSSFNSIQGKLEKLPPPPTKYTRIFGTNEMKAITKKRYAHLPEVTEKAEKEKSEKQRRSNRLLKDIFNKNLQKRVRNGQLSLNHSGTVI